MPEAIKWGESKRVQVSSCMTVICCLNVLWASEGRDQLSSTHSWGWLSLADGILPMHGLGLALLHSSHYQGHPVAGRKGQDLLSHVHVTANADERQGSSPEP